MEELVLMFFNDLRVRAIMALIVVDFLLGIAAALRRGEFDLKKVADFYRTNVIPYLLGYAAFYIGARLVGPDLAVLGDWAYLLEEGTLTVVWAAILAALGKDIITHIQDLGIGGVVKRFLG